MASQEDVRRIALTLPGAREEEGRFAFSVENKGKQKGFVWVWLERVDPRKPRTPRADVIAVRVRDQAEKAALLAGDPEMFFTEPHYNGFPAVLVRLPVVRAAQLRKLIFDAWPGPAAARGGGRGRSTAQTLVGPIVGVHRRPIPGREPTPPRPGAGPFSAEPRPF